MATPEARALGLPFVPRLGPPGANLVLGADVAIQGLFRAMLEHAACARFQFFCDPRLASFARDKLAAAIGATRPTPHLVVRSVNELADAIERGELRAFHTPRLSVGPVFRLRSAYARRAFPITLLNHSFSYRRMLHDTFLRLLVADVRPYDSLICSSNAAKRALTTLLEHVAETFDAQHGTRLEFRGRMDVIPLGVDTQLWHPRDRDPLRAQLHLPREATIVLYLGRFSTADKADLLPLLDVFARLARDLGDEELCLILAGTDRTGFGPVLEARAAELGVGDDVRIVVDPTTPHLLMAASDIFVSPADNIQEAFGLTPVEAMASGVPQIVADWSGYRESVVDGQTGFTIPTLWAECDDDLIINSATLSSGYLDHLALAQSVAVDPQVMYTRLRELICNHELRRAMGEASRKRAVERYSWSVVVGQYDALWDELDARAASDERAPTIEHRYTDPPFARAFGHFATRLLSDDVRLTVTDAGTAITDHAGLPARHPADASADTLALGALRRLAAGTVQLGALSTAVAREHDCNPARARRSVLWLLKRDLARIDTDE